MTEQNPQNPDKQDFDPHFPPLVQKFNTVKYHLFDLFEFAQKQATEISESFRTKLKWSQHIVNFYNGLGLGLYPSQMRCIAQYEQNEYVKQWLSKYNTQVVSPLDDVLSVFLIYDRRINLRNFLRQQYVKSKNDKESSDQVNHHFTQFYKYHSILSVDLEKFLEKTHSIIDPIVLSVHQLISPYI